MPTLLAAKDLSLYDLEQRFGLQLAIAPDLLVPWLQTQPPLTPPELEDLDRIRRYYLNLNRRRPLLEDLVKMVVLSPLLARAGFYDRDFEIKTEEKVEITINDEDTIVRGFIDILIVQQQLWLLVIETKRTQINVTTALPQILFYMLNRPSDRPIYGLATNGLEFIFLELATQDEQLYCRRSYALSLERNGEIEQILNALKFFSQQLEVRN
ncbi:MAG: type I restriction endonuclease subunit R [Spirulina sp.]